MTKKSKYSSCSTCNCDKDYIILPYDSSTCKDKKVSCYKHEQKVRNYRLTVTDTGTDDGYFLQHNTEISIFDYANILSQYFGVDISIDYDYDCEITAVDEK